MNKTISKEDFESRMALINEYKAEAQKYLDSYKIHLGNITNPNSVVGKIEERDALYSAYLEYIQKYAYADLIIYPSDLFPGIGIDSKNLSDPVAMQKETKEMEKTYSTILADNEVIQVQSKWLQDELKYMLSDLNEYMNLSNQVYDMEEKLLLEMDTIYDVGRFARNT